jgi:hypothetical protein
MTPRKAQGDALWAAGDAMGAIAAYAPPTATTRAAP